MLKGIPSKFNGSYAIYALVPGSPILKAIRALFYASFLTQVAYLGEKLGLSGYQG